MDIVPLVKPYLPLAADTGHQFSGNVEPLKGDKLAATHDRKVGIVG